MHVEEFIRAIPKAELHLHIEGSFEPDLMFAIAQRNSIELPYPDIDAIRAAYTFSSLQEFLDIYYQGMNVLRQEADFYDLTMAYLRRAAADNVRHCELFFDPQAHTVRGVEFATVVNGIHRALQDGQRQLGLSSHLILCFLRHLDEADAFATLEQALPHRHQIIGVGLDSSELGHPPAGFERVFAAAAKAGFRRVAHAGEEGPVNYITEALDRLKIERIDHGNRCLDDEALCRRIAEQGTALTICPLSNLQLGVVPKMTAHPFPQLLQRGIRVTINSDDPAYFGGYINDNFLALNTAFCLSKSTVADLCRNSFLAAFIDAQEKAGFVGQVDEFLARNG